jgi:hypothetical protein
MATLTPLPRFFSFSFSVSFSFSASPFLPGILRLLYAYFNELPRDEAPFLKIPLHRVMKLRVDQSGCSESVIELGELADQDRDVPSC